MDGGEELKVSRIESSPPETPDDANRGKGSKKQGKVDWMDLRARVLCWPFCSFTLRSESPFST